MSVTRFLIRLSIRNKIALAFFVVLVLVAILGLGAAQQLAALDRSVNTLSNKALVATRELGEMRDQLLRYRLGVARYMFGKTADPAFKTSTDAALAGYREHDAKYAATRENDAERAMHERLATATREYLDAASRGVALYLAGKLDEAKDAYLADGGVAKGEALDALLKSATQDDTDEANRLRAAAEADYGDGIWTIVGLFAAAVILACGVGYALVRGIARPLVRASLVLGQLARRDYDFVLRQAGRGDEIGDLSVAMDKLRGALQEADHIAAAQNAEQAARARRQSAMESHTRDFGDSISGVMASLSNSATIMRRAAETMSQAATEVHDEASATSSGAAASSRDLASVTTAVEQLNAGVGEISRQLDGATEVARQAVQRAESSQSTMRGLSDATVRIGDVVNLISDIAGQTNLLRVDATS
jgi:methyl-accepting chemotaxis protein